MAKSFSERLDHSTSFESLLWHDESAPPSATLQRAVERFPQLLAESGLKPWSLHDGPLPDNSVLFGVTLYNADDMQLLDHVAERMRANNGFIICRQLSFHPRTQTSFLDLVPYVLDLTQHDLSTVRKLFPGLDAYHHSPFVKIRFSATHCVFLAGYDALRTLK